MPNSIRKFCDCVRRFFGRGNRSVTPTVINVNSKNTFYRSAGNDFQFHTKDNDGDVFVKSIRWGTNTNKM